MKRKETEKRAGERKKIKIENERRREKEREREGDERREERGGGTKQHFQTDLKPCLPRISPFNHVA